MNHSALYLSVIQPNHTQNVISGLWGSQYWPVYGIGSGHISGRVLCSKQKIIAIRAKPNGRYNYRGGRTSESRNSEGQL